MLIRCTCGTTEDNTELEATALQKENRLLNTQSENWTSHLTTSGVALKVTYWELCRVFITGVIYQLFSMVLLLSALVAES